MSSQQIPHMINRGLTFEHWEFQGVDPYESAENNRRSNGRVGAVCRIGITGYGLREYTRMLNDAEDSPLVEGNQGVGDKNQPAAIVAVAYTF